MPQESYYVKRSALDQIRLWLIIAFDVVLSLVVSFPIIAIEIYKSISYTRKDIRGKLALVNIELQDKVT